jgi:predicted RNA-binding Zn-ribbon protein involved in translation (DUF1610 family)
MEPVPNFQCPKCGKMSVVKYLVLILPPTPNSRSRGFYRFKCLACGYVFGETWEICFWRDLGAVMNIVTDN